MLRMTWRRPIASFLPLAAFASAALAGPLADLRPVAAQRFQLFPAPPAADAATPLAGLCEPRVEYLLRLPGDPDSVFTLGGPSPSGQASVRLAVEVNEVIPKLLAPDPKVDSSDSRGGRTGGDWKPLDAAGRPYQLRFGARLIW
jgi:hypothetical protein